MKDIHDLLDQLFTLNSKTNNAADLVDEISPVFVSDYNLIINSKLQILQIHRLVWLAAVRATQRQRGKDPQHKRMPPEQLLSNALDEIVKKKFLLSSLLTTFSFVLVIDNQCTD